ncbi:unnamed protein product [Hydatigera taeniaeformis]|uniref:WD_REPEATS_REGION domain-containing protein n=1 Tax=Hydatigena taeniaeformis TaxID=6205 RepID=A0A0R3WHN7_HYDTA|nr:unnamed protein product [Hydatigera taeniaeformis]
MFVSKSVHSNHADLIHDVAYDYYGQRMATCSSDQMIKIWDLRDDQEWECTARWRYHLGSVWRVCWAHPEFGQIIATCSFDRTIAIWEEITGQVLIIGVLCILFITSGDAPTPTPATGACATDTGSSQQSAAVNPTSTSNTRGGVWIRRAHLVDPRNSVTGLMFAPRFLGLQLAAISTDGVLLVYEAQVHSQFSSLHFNSRFQDVMNLCQWTVQCDFATNMTGSCLAWSQSRLDPPLIAVGSASLHRNQHQGELGELGACHLAVQGSDVNSGHGKLILLEYNENSRRWNLVQDIVDIKDPVYDVAFAPSMGQSYQVLAVGSEILLILLIKFVTAPQVAENGVNTPGAYNVSVMARFENHGGRVSRVAWNYQGNILASAGDDGTVRLWCSNYLKAWFPLAVIRPGEISLPTPPSHLSATSAIAAMDQQSHGFPSGATAATTATINAINAPHVSASSSSLYPRDTIVSTNITEPPPSGLLASATSDVSVASTTSVGKSSCKSALFWEIDVQAKFFCKFRPGFVASVVFCLGMTTILFVYSFVETTKPVRFTKSGSVVYARNQVVWH